MKKCELIKELTRYLDDLYDERAHICSNIKLRECNPDKLTNTEIGIVYTSNLLEFVKDRLYDCDEISDIFYQEYDMLTVSIFSYFTTNKHEDALNFMIARLHLTVIMNMLHI